MTVTINYSAHLIKKKYEFHAENFIIIFFYIPLLYVTFKKHKLIKTHFTLRIF